MSRTLHLAEQLISLPSITPEDAGCLELLAARLAPLGFVCERLDSGPADFRVSNLWAKRPVSLDGKAQAAIKTVVFAGHTDVVPTGPLAQLSSDEEGPSVDGTKVVVEQLKARGEKLDYCIVGEPTSVEKTGDMIKNGRS